VSSEPEGAGEAQVMITIIYPAQFCTVLAGGHVRVSGSEEWWHSHRPAYLAALDGVMPMEDGLQHALAQRYGDGGEEED
jgi:hypothetical protein